MSDSFDIASATGSYHVQLESGAFARWTADWAQTVVVADDFFRDALSAAVPTALFYPASETIKSLDASPELIGSIRKLGANRQSRIVAVGGGVIQDMTAFVASIYMRGVQWSYVPTTILAMVDSCIGGKSSINVGPYKNLVGTFHPPAEVLVDPALAATLPLDQQASGIIEAAKICYCRGAESFRQYVSLKPQPGMHTEGLERVISHSLRTKKWFIEIDEYDQKERLLLNFGHTFGHAIEGASHYRISHGIAVGLGILCALAFVRLEEPSVDPYVGTPALELEQTMLDLLGAVPGLQSELEAVSVSDVLERFAADKKHKRDDYVLILVDRAGEVVLRKIAKTPESRSRVETAIRSVLEGYAS